METITTSAGAEKEKVDLWHHGNFLKLWASDTISQFGTQFSGLAIPFTFLLLSKDPVIFGLLGTAGTIAWPVTALFVGVYVDSHSRKRIMTLANIGRGIALGSIPLVTLAGLLPLLGISLLFIVAFTIGLLTVFFDISYQSILPSLVDRDQLVQGNTMLEISRSSAQVAGPAMAGVVVQAVYPPLTLAIDASSYFASASFISSMLVDEKFDRSTKPILLGLWEGLYVVLSDSRLRMIAGSTSTSNLFSNALFVVAFLYVVEALGFTPGIYGFVLTTGAVGLLAGIYLSSKIVKRIGLGLTIVLGMVIGGLGYIPYAIVNPSFASPTLAVLGPLPALGIIRIDRNVLLLMLAQFIVSIGVVVYNINQVSLRQALVPLRLQGRMNASMRWIVWSTLPAGAALGGFLGSTYGLKPALEITVIGGLFAFLWVLLSPVRLMKTMPEQST